MARITRLLVLVALLAVSACGSAWQMATPAGFVPFRNKSGPAFITADGVRCSLRTEDNYPKADLTFWTDALQRHLVARGYLLQGQRCFKTSAGLGGCTSEFVVPHGGEDWVLAETIYVTGDELQILEAAGPFDRYKKVAPALEAAYLTFAPK